MKLIIVGVLSASLCTWAAVQPVKAQHFYVRVQPAAPVVVVPARPGPRYIWVAPEYRWVNGAYVVVPGRWVPPPRGYRRWIPGHWARHPRYGSYWVPGHWR